MSEQSKVEALIHVASRLIAVLEREVELLRNMKADAVAALQPDKMKLVVAYEEQVRSLAESLDALEKIAPALRAEFSDIAERFDAAMTENRRAISAAQQAQERFLAAVVRAAEEKRSSLQTYSSGGALPAPKDRNAGMGPLSLTLNQQL